MAGLTLVKSASLAGLTLVQSASLTAYIWWWLVTGSGFLSQDSFLLLCFRFIFHVLSDKPSLLSRFTVYPTANRRFVPVCLLWVDLNIYSYLKEKKTIVIVALYEMEHSANLQYWLYHLPVLHPHLPNFFHSVGLPMGCPLYIGRIVWVAKINFIIKPNYISDSTVDPC